MENYNQSFVMDEHEEEASPAMHIPVVIGTELFVLTQQDKRCVKDVRELTYTRWVPNEQQLPMDPSSGVPGNVFSFPILNTSSEPEPEPEIPSSEPDSPPIVRPLDIAELCKVFFPIASSDIANLMCESRGEPEPEPEAEPEESPSEKGDAPKEAKTPTYRLMTSIGCQYATRNDMTNKGCQTTASLIGVTSQKPKFP